MKWAVHVARMGRRLHSKFCLENQKEVNPGRPRCRWVDNIKMDLRDMLGWYGLD
jgi:hypothetical protein